MVCHATAGTAAGAFIAGGVCLAPRVVIFSCAVLFRLARCPSAVHACVVCFAALSVHHVERTPRTAPPQTQAPSGMRGKIAPAAFQLQFHCGFLQLITHVQTCGIVPQLEAAHITGIASCSLHVFRRCARHGCISMHCWLVFWLGAQVPARPLMCGHSEYVVDACVWVCSMRVRVS